MNKVILIGRLCNDVDVRYTDKGTAVASYRLAVDRPNKKDGKSEADFISCVAFGKTAEFAKNYLGKGLKVAIEGSVRTRNYDDKDGKKVYVTEVIAEEVHFADSKKDSTNSFETGFNPITPSSPEDGFMPVVDDTQLPF
jgi:single-strand DNA-binding protein